MFWYEEEVKQLERKFPGAGQQPATLFYGSSSIRQWPQLKRDFPDYNPVNLGFGGSTLAACSWFFERIVAPYNARAIVIYAGDNDLGDGRHPEEVFIFYQQLAAQIKARYSNIPCFFVSIKPSPARWGIVGSLKYTNHSIEHEIMRQAGNWSFIDVFEPMLKKDGMPDEVYFEADGLHLSTAGYALWQGIIAAKLAAIVHPCLT
jgi:lysophospholipase L1-like esterase